MKVVCFGSGQGTGGGATIAMERMAGALAAVADVRIVSLDGPAGRSPQFATTDSRLASTRGIATHVRRGIRRGRSSLTNTLFSIDWPAWDVVDHPDVRDADVINIHWVTSFLNAAAIRRLIDTGRPVVWTLHDQRAFTGGCHYTAGCTGFTSVCAECPQLVGDAQQAARRVLATSRRQLSAAALTFVTPSRWLGDELRRSSLFNPDQHEQVCIPYGIDLTRFAPRGDKAALRRRFGLPERGLGVVLGSVSLTESRKGFAQARAAVEEYAALLRREAASLPAPFVVTFGSGAFEIDGIACHHLGRQDEAGVIEILNAGDVFLMMTREDNLPNTVMESLACGLPVVGTRVGGVPDMVEHGREGWLVERDDAHAAARVLLDITRSPAALPAAARAARSRAEACYPAEHQAQRYLELFTRLLGSARPRDGHSCGRRAALPMLPLSPAAAGVVAMRVRGRSWARLSRRLRRRLG